MTDTNAVEVIVIFRTFISCSYCTFYYFLNVRSLVWNIIHNLKLRLKNLRHVQLPDTKELTRTRQTKKFL